MDPFITHIRSTTNTEEIGRATILDRPVLGSLQDSWFNSSNQHYVWHESPLHASVEALLLLNNAQFNHASFANSNSFPAGKENVSTQSDGISITAPVPLSYAVRGKEALKSILSIGEDNEDEEVDSDSTAQKQNEPVTVEGSQVFKDESSNALPEIEITAPMPGPILPIFPIFDIPQEQALANDQPWPTATTALPKRPFVRSISSSTLMALTEPCLMAWCYDPDFDLNVRPQYSSMNAQVYNLSSVPVVYDAPTNMDYVMPSQNVWGY
ncbi:hypothetical protein CVT25_013567 [Psilocybe cyanescens]|uniref:Uncharacterized protein n=1 Tax=Psilocybe cyanescens TaxID=93625 RepID=A0A409XT09_PSICY|nr:hypothetical protein CVT25_013567 [Psilocybe cyanescens]